MDSDNEDQAEGTYTDGDRAFLQAIMARGSLTFKEGRAILGEIISIEEGREVPLESVSEHDFNSRIGIAAAMLNPFDYEIKATSHQRTKVRTWAIINATSDPLTQLATTHTPEEIGFIKRMLDGMFETYNTRRKEVMAVSSMQALERKFLKGAGGARESGEGTQVDKGLSGTDAEACLESLIKEGWFEKSREGFYSLSPRALMELRTWLVETYNDPEDPEEWQPIKFCEACRDIVTTGQRCSQPECSVRLHDICDVYWNSKPDKKCPRCETVWDGKGLVGQKVVTSTDEYLRDKRRSNGMSGRRAREEVEEEEEDDENDDEREDE